MDLISKGWNVLGVIASYWTILSVMVFTTALFIARCRGCKDSLKIAGIFCIGFTAYAFGKWWMQDPVCTTNLLPSWPLFDYCPAPSWWRLSYSRTKAPFDLIATVITGLAGAVAGILLGGLFRSLAKTAVVIVIIIIAIVALSYLR